MGLFKADFFRSLALGFAVGAVVVFTMFGTEPAGVSGAVAPPAIAATE